MSYDSFDQSMMRRALRLARRGLGKTRPNPAVGCVIVGEGRIVGQGYHHRAGEPHAEIMAMNAAARSDLEGAACYVTMEPCNHDGRTPPCTHAILDCGITRVIFGMKDPNPDVTGDGSGFLAAHGLQVDGPLLEKECVELNRHWIKHRLTNLPWVIVKMAASLDGRTATSAGHTRWISNERSRRHTHHLRFISGAIMVGANTVVSDDPDLTARIGERVVGTPARIVVDSTLKCRPESRIFRRDHPGETCIMTTDAATSERIDLFKSTGARIVRMKSYQGRVDLLDVLKYLGKSGVDLVMVEGGPELAFGLIERRLADEFWLFASNQLFGGRSAPGVLGGNGFASIEQAPVLYDLKIQRLDTNFLIRGYFRELMDVYRNYHGNR